jgi:phage shock protein B
MFMETLVPLIVVAILFIGLPWIILHYVTRWKTAATLTSADENLMEDLYELSRRLEDRLCTVERILTAENPNWRAIACDPLAERLPPPAAADRLQDRIMTNAPGARIGK